MTKLLIKLFVKDSENTKDLNVRGRYGILSGIVGIVCNIILAVSKFIIGTFTGSIAITADSVNNLSDAGTSAVTLLSFKLANRPADDEHPFGHGRFEYISALAASFLILIMGIELIRSSVDRIINPARVEFSYAAVVVLLMSIGVKIWLGTFNRHIGKKIDSPAMSAAMTDSFSDTLATTVSMIALILSKFTQIPLDGYMGIIVAMFIIAAGTGIFKDTMDTLLGSAPDPTLVESIEKEILSYEGILGVHDLIIHNYGPSRMFASAHAEVPSDADIMETHDTVDRIERDIKKKFDLEIVIHMDPIVVNDKKVNDTREKINAIVKDIDSEFSMHDFRMVEGPTHTNLIFDLVVPHKCQLTRKEIFSMVNEQVKKLDENYFTVITVEHDFVEHMH